MFQGNHDFRMFCNPAIPSISSYYVFGKFLENKINLNVSCQISCTKLFNEVITL